MCTKKKKKKKKKKKTGEEEKQEEKRRNWLNSIRLGLGVQSFLRIKVYLKLRSENIRFEKRYLK